MLIVILIAAGVLSLIGGFIVGKVVGGHSGAPTTPTHENDPNPAACQDACTQWDTRRTERCGLQADEAVARSRADSRRSDLNTALLVAAAALAAAVALSAIPIYGWAASIIPYAAATVASVYASYLAGLLQAASDDLARAEQATHDARIREASARALVQQRCSPAEAAACLSVPGSC